MITRPKFSISVVAEAPDHTIRAARAAESQDFDVIYVGDVQSTHRELYTSLALIASTTSKITIGPGVTNPVTRHPAVTAGAIATLDEISGGRAFLGLGVGDSAVHNVGARPATLARTENYLNSIKTMWRHGEATYRDVLVRGRQWERDIPVAFTAHGPKSLALAGRVAQMVIAGVGMTPEAVEYTLEHVELGVRESGRPTDDVEIWFLCYPHVGDESDLRGEVGSALAAGGNLLAKSPAAVTIPYRYRSAMTDLAARYDYSTHVHPSPDSPNNLLINELGLVDYLAERFGLIGNGVEIRAQLDEHRARGVDNYWCVYTRPNLSEHVDRWGLEIISPLNAPA